MTVHANPPSTCDLCDAPIRKIFFDARVPGLGQWGNLCRSCFERSGAKTGLGHGQRYEQQPDGSWLKTAG